MYRRIIDKVQNQLIMVIISFRLNSYVKTIGLGFLRLKYSFETCNR